MLWQGEACQAYGSFSLNENENSIAENIDILRGCRERSPLGRRAPDGAVPPPAPRQATPTTRNVEPTAPRTPSATPSRHSVRSEFVVLSHFSTVHEPPSSPPAITARKPL
ncbi:hypothetical protein C5F51_08745 [Nocardia nova]|uniref:Uncharacterized protein n=1 Tax=Nocardia nova TaxID=37330 RepID=A0A2S6AAN5_9NOCA|nr:hypothetical protein C5F51_08745 [Nocardia nova]